MSHTLPQHICLATFALLLPLTAHAFSLKNNSGSLVDIAIRRTAGTHAEIERSLRSRKNTVPRYTREKGAISGTIKAVTIFRSGTFERDVVTKKEIPQGGTTLDIPIDGRYILMNRGTRDAPVYELHGTTQEKTPGETMIKYYKVVENPGGGHRLDTTSPSMVVRKESEDDRSERIKKRKRRHDD